MSKESQSPLSSTYADAIAKNPSLGIAGFDFPDLYAPHRLATLYNLFIDELEKNAPDIFKNYIQYRDAAEGSIPPTQISQTLIAVAPYVSRFVGKIFGIEAEQNKQKEKAKKEFDTIFRCRITILKEDMRLMKKEPPPQEETLHERKSKFAYLRTVAGTLWGSSSDPELDTATMGLWIKNIADNFGINAKNNTIENPEAVKQIAALKKLLKEDSKGNIFFTSFLKETEDKTAISVLYKDFLAWCKMEIEQAVNSNNHAEENWILFKDIHKRDFDNLVPCIIEQHEGVNRWRADVTQINYRDGFYLTDPRYQDRAILHEVDHCIYCHERDTDSCSKGMRNKKDHGYKKNPLGSSLIGCPLEEKISEMHVMRRQGDMVAALALIMIDNPMCPGTGHRICNDCMKGCIYQKTEPVNIPQVETNVLTEVIFSEYGFEIYSLLAKWNPLNIKRSYALPYNGKKILVAGLGPAGYTLSHYLLNEGFAVVGIDALKIEPLADAICDTNNAIKSFLPLYEDLSQRSHIGFGGVAEYGITVRWDKNFLKIIYLYLLRRTNFLCHGGVRFGGTLTVDDAWEAGFDHIAMATGAGKPTVIGMQNNLVRGIRKASDFLMALQLTGAGKKHSMANLQIRLPAGVVGGGLTAIDTCTEIMAYYPIQVEKILNRYQALSQKYGEEKIRSRFDEEELEILDEFLEHGASIHAEREKAIQENRKPDFITLVQKWGGVTLLYRKGIKEAPAYRQNHEEIIEALKEGIFLAEGVSPYSAEIDEYEALQSLTCKKLAKKMESWIETGETVSFPLKSLFIAAGTSPNTIYEQEHPYTFRMQGKYFQRYRINAEKTDGAIELIPLQDDSLLPKLAHSAPFTSYHKEGRTISFYGDNHPVYSGNVVKAMASAKDGYPSIAALFSKELATLSTNRQAQQIRNTEFKRFATSINNAVSSKIHAINRLAPTIIEVIVKAPMQAKKFQPGQFYRVQNYESYAVTHKGTGLVAEALALTGAWVDKEAGLISLITLEMGSSSRMCATWKIGDPIVVMGVTGTPTVIPKDKTVMLIGGGLGNAVLFSIGATLRNNNNKVVYFAGYRKPEDMFMMEQIENAADIVVWAVDSAGNNTNTIKPRRPQDKSIVGNIIQAIEQYADGTLGEKPINLQDVTNIIVIGSDKMMNAVKKARHNQLKQYLNKEHIAIGSINSPMQCMMKGICAQCLCKHVDPHTKEESFVYSCYNQDQPLDYVDFDNLAARLRQNSVQEKISNTWLDLLFSETQAESV